MTFSAITTDESTSTPIEIAIPASDMALAWMSTMPSRRRIAMIRNDDSAASGSVLAMTSEVRTCSRTSSTHSEAETIASTTVPVTVPIGPLDQRRPVVERDDPNARAAGRLAARGSSP